jgi:mRNA interferase HigB
MQIISKRIVGEFLEEYPKSINALLNWYKIAKHAEWTNFADIRKTFGRASIYKNCVIFDIGGNKYRLIAQIRYQSKLVFIRRIMTHAEYDKGRWKDDCEC